MRKRITGLFASIVAFFLFASAGLMVSGAPITLLTNTSGCQEANQLLFCLNTLINTLNGNASGSLVSVGTFATSSGGGINGTTPIPTPCGSPCTNPLGPGTSAGSGSGFTPVVLNAQRGVATFTTPLGIASASSTLMVVNSFATAQSVCAAVVTSNGGSTTAIPYVASYTPTAGFLNFIIANGQQGQPAQPTQTYAISFNCM